MIRGTCDVQFLICKRRRIPQTSSLFILSNFRFLMMNVINVVLRNKYTSGKKAFTIEELSLENKYLKILINF